jgi:YgiT-type zinc finger domain-containing protein
MQCFFCKGDLIKGFAMHFSQAGSCFIIIKNVPCHICDQCGEVLYNGIVWDKLDNTVLSLKDEMLEIEIANYPDKIA